MRPRTFSIYFYFLTNADAYAPITQEKDGVVAGPRVPG